MPCQILEVLEKGLGDENNSAKNVEIDSTLRQFEKG